ncbi:glycosyltransferase family 2 protein [Sphingomonas sp. FW199]|uniref:glycosyltransferase family 2 protein n=1 Tax=Sphingomonas sp. FW199 TaxID=3400217 RepID=UPI003CF557CF
MTGRPAEPLIAVVIPNYNGAATIDETLISVRAQTHAHLEIIVVDDGSTDDSTARVARHITSDRRVRQVEQENAGVAAARNHGWRSTNADLVAFIDSDDVWSPDKLARQLDVMTAGGADVGLVYAGYALIDADRRVIECRPSPALEGDVLHRLMCGNFVANGSAALVRRRVLEATGGFEPALHHAGAQGCEDYLFYLRAAGECRFGVVAAPLVGYRRLPGAMSSNVVRMLRSWRMVLDEMAMRHPGMIPLMRRGYRNYAAWLARAAMFAGRFGQLGDILKTIAAFDAGMSARIALVDLPRALRGAVMGRIWPKRTALITTDAQPLLTPGSLYPIGLVR